VRAADALGVACPFCRQPAGSPCISFLGWATKNPENHVHASRIAVVPLTLGADTGYVREPLPRFNCAGNVRLP
jgi:hypothetical protein